MNNNKAFTVLEVLISIACISAMLYIISVSFYGIKRSSNKVILSSNVDMLNRSVSLYRSTYGKFPDAKNTFEAIKILKSTPNFKRPNFKIISKKPIIHPDTSFNIQSKREFKSKDPRIYWDNDENKFLLSNKGDKPGIKGIILSSSPSKKNNDVSYLSKNLLPPIASPTGYDFKLSDFPSEVSLKNINKDKSTLIEYILINKSKGDSDLSKQKWIPYKNPIFIPFNNKLIARTYIYSKENNANIKAHSDNLIEIYNLIPQNLKPPIIYPKGGKVSSTGFNFPISIENPNEEGTSKILYSLNNGKGWIIYKDNPIPVKPNDVILARVVPYCSKEGELYPSPEVQEEYILSETPKEDYLNEVDAARYITNRINPISVDTKKEHCGLICKNGPFYTYTVHPGNYSSCSILLTPCKEGSLISAFWHTHGNDDPNYNNESFSYAVDENGEESGDIGVSHNFFDTPIYLGTPKGKFKVYKPTRDIRYPDSRSIHDLGEVDK